MTRPGLESPLTPTITVEGVQKRNLLFELAADRVVPEGCSHWGIRSVHAGRSSSCCFVYPPPGCWAHAPGPLHQSNTSPCPLEPGDGLCLATQIGDYPLWGAVASGRICASRLLLVAFHHRDVLGVQSDGCKVRVTRMHVVADIDGWQLLREHGEHADVRHLRIGATNGGFEHATEAGIAWAQAVEVAATVDVDYYADAVQAGATHTELAEVLAEDQLAIWKYTHARAHATHQQIMQAHRGGVSVPEYASARHAGATHETILRHRT